LGVICAVLLLSAFAVTVAVGFKIADAISRIQVDPASVADWIKQATTHTLEQGAPEQKLEIIRVLGEAGAEAREYSQSLVNAALADNDPRVREAAAAALKKVDPDAAVQFGID
jgi:hypothetical protein